VSPSNPRLVDYKAANVAIHLKAGKKHILKAVNFADSNKLLLPIKSIAFTYFVNLSTFKYRHIVTLYLLSPISLTHTQTEVKRGRGREREKGGVTFLPSLQ